MPPADGAAGPLIDTGAAKSPARRWPQGGASRIPNWVYTDPEIFAREQRRVFEGAGWLYVCLEAEIPNPGDFVRSRLGTRRWSRCATRTARSTCWSTAAPIEVRSSARPRAARPRNSSAPTTNGPTI